MRWKTRRNKTKQTRMLKLHRRLLTYKASLWTNGEQFFSPNSGLRTLLFSDMLPVMLISIAIASWYIDCSVFYFFSEVVNLQVGACWQIGCFASGNMFCLSGVLITIAWNMKSTLMPFFGNCIFVSVMKITFLETT